MEYFINAHVKENIDFDYILDKLHVVTPYGASLKSKLKPFMPGEELKLINELDTVDTLIRLIKENRQIFDDIRSILSHIKDLKKSIIRCTEGNTLTSVELFEIKSFIFLIRELEQNLKLLKWNIPEDMKVKSIPQVESLLDPANTGIKAFYIYDEYSENLKEIRGKKKAIEKEIAEEKRKLRDKIKEELNVNIRPDGQMLVSKSHQELIKKIENHPYISYSSETYMNISFKLKLPDTINKLERELVLLKEREENEEYNIRTRLSKDIAAYSEEIFKNMDYIGKFDLTLAKGLMAIHIKGVKPIITNKNVVYISDGRHLKVEDNLKSKGQRYIPVSIRIGQGVTCITGANMGGKTVTLKMIGLLTTMAQYGFFVPCTKMEMGLQQFIYISTGDYQSIDMGLSTFGAEIKGLQEAIGNKDKRGLILIDELARGTNPEEGFAISKAIVNYLKRGSCITVITTHYDNVANSEDVVHLQVVGLSNVDLAKLENQIRGTGSFGIDIINKHMDYRLTKATEKSQAPRDAINIARLMGLDKEILEEAEKIMFKYRY